MRHTTLQSLLTLTGLLLLLILSRGFAAWNDDGNDETDYVKYGHEESFSLKRTLAKLGLDTVFENTALYIKKNVDEAQRYNNFESDWKKVLSEPSPTNIFNFVRNVTLPSFVKSCVMMQNVWKGLYSHIMKFTREKCDLFFGKEAPLHPWNAVKQDRHTVSFLVFVYGLALSLILLKLCSWWNFLLWLVSAYLAYTLAGPHWCFRWLVFVTGCFWYIFDMIFTYPYHVASAFLVISVYSYISSMRRRPSIQVSPGREFKQLNDRVVGVEKKTDMIQNKIDRLTELIEKVDLN